jgi:hydrogenase maturation protease
VHGPRPRGEGRAESLHELGIAGLLAALGSVAREPPEIVVIGAEVGEITPFAGRLSPPVEAAVPEAVRLVLAELQGCVASMDGESAGR